MLIAALSARSVGLVLVLVLAADLHALDRVLATPPDWAVRCRIGQPLPAGRVVPGVDLHVRVLTPAPVVGGPLDLDVRVVNRGDHRLRLLVPQRPTAAYVVLSAPGRGEVMGGPHGRALREVEANVPPHGVLRLPMRGRSATCSDEGERADALGAGFYEVVVGVRLASRTDRAAYLISIPVGVVLGVSP